MLFRKSKAEQTIDLEINKVFERMAKEDISGVEYETYLSDIERLTNLKVIMTERKVSKDTLVIVGANLLGIALILGYEQMHVVSSKALGFVIRGRV